MPVKGAGPYDWGGIVLCWPRFHPENQKGEGFSMGITWESEPAHRHLECRSDT